MMAAVCWPAVIAVRPSELISVISACFDAWHTAAGSGVGGR